MKEKNKNHKYWQRGVDMPEFSGKSWAELQDMWPADVRLNSDPWKIISVFAPAWLATMKFMDGLMDGKHIHMRDFFILCWVQRCEEARSNVAFTMFAPSKGMNIGKTLWTYRQSQLTKLGLIEGFPTNGAGKARLYRVTGLGKMVIQNFIDNVEQAHKDVKVWSEEKQPEYIKRIDRYLSHFCFDWKEVISSEPGSPHSEESLPKDSESKSR